MDKEINQNSTKKALAVVTVFSKSDTVLGLPTNAAGLGMTITVILFFFLSKIMAVIFGLVFFRVMFAIHEDDPKGFEVWRSVLYRRTSGWCCSKVRSTRLIILKNK